MCIFQECLKHGIRLEMEWIPRGQNETADYISCIVDVELVPLFFRSLILCGVHIQLTDLPQRITRNCRASIADFGALGLKQ